MSVEALYQNYALALFNLAEKEDLRVYLEGMAKIKEDLSEKKGLGGLLSCYDVSSSEKEKIIDQVYKDFLPSNLVSFLKVVTLHHRIAYFKGIEKEFRQKADEALGIKEGIAFTGEKLTPKQLEQLQTALAKKLNAEVYLRNEVDQHLLGGVRVAIDGKVYDGSLYSRMNNLKKTLLEGGK